MMMVVKRMVVMIVMMIYNNEVEKDIDNLQLMVRKRKVMTDDR